MSERHHYHCFVPPIVVSVLRLSGRLLAVAPVMPDPTPPLRYAFDEVVRVVGDDPELDPIRGERAVVVGRTEPGAPPGYAVFVYRLGRVWEVEEHELEPTGEHDPREGPTHAVRIRVDAAGGGHAVGIRKL